MKKITDLSEWQALKQHQERIAPQTMQSWFEQDPQRFDRFSISVGEILLDYSKNRITDETINLLINLANAARLPEKINALMTGQTINTTEKRAAFHTALRDQNAQPPEVRVALQQMQQFVETIRAKQWLGATGKPIQTIVNIGIGGSHLGPLMTTYALSDYADSNFNAHFISDIDSAHLHAVLNQVDPETTLFIISSKSFTTLETMTNANTVRAWLQSCLPNHNIQTHFVAVTAAADRAMKFGIPAPQIFPLWDWVGGRYSIWSPIGLPLAILIGMPRFLEFLAGAHAMDEHFKTADFKANMPVIMGLLGVWYINFFGANNQAITPYAHALNHFRAYLQQADMESNGKSTTHSGTPIDYATGPIIWGELGCNAQHAFNQLLHQGNYLIPVDFILVKESTKGFSHHQDILAASCLSQAQALMQGKNYDQVYAELIASGCPESEAKCLAQHKTIPGNRPSNIVFIDKLTPYNLGALIALYEHKIFVQGAIWDINSFDQWGVELGKQLLPKILEDLTNNQIPAAHDASTRGLIEHYKKTKDIV